MKIHNRIIIGLVSVLLIGLMTPAPAASGDKSANWSELHELISAAMHYILENHPESPVNIQEKNGWSLVITPVTNCKCNYQYTGGGWTVHVCYPETGSGNVEIQAEYSKSGINWTGVVNNGKVTEISYTYPALKITPREN